MRQRIYLFIFMILLSALVVGCSTKTNYETDGPFIIFSHSPAGPDEYRNMFARNYSITENGKLTLYTESEDRIKIGDDAPVYEAQLQKSEVEKLKQLIEKNKFWNLQEDVSDDNSVDGSFLSITVNLTDQSKTVGGLNPNDSKFTEIADYIFNLIDVEDYRQWEEEIMNYIFKMNPE